MMLGGDLAVVLVPAERSTGETVRRTGLTLAGNRRARRVLVEAAWSYRHPARVSETLRVRLEELPKTIRDIAWKAQVRLCGRYRRECQFNCVRAFHGGL